VKRLMVANWTGKNTARYNPEKMDTLLKAQIENALDIGWQPEDITFLSNFDFEFMKVKAETIPMNEFCLSGSKMFALKWLFDQGRVQETYWSLDLDAWQNVWIDEPQFDTDVGCSTYSNFKYNGGSIFWKPLAMDIVNEVVKRIESGEEPKEEPTLNKVFKSKKYKSRVTILNYSYNVGCSGFIPRFEKSLKPIRVCHFHPPNNVAWEIHALDRTGIRQIPVTIRLERLLRKYYPNLATKLRKR
jgi:hypothetical protein